ncbi:Phage holin [plant metagenome]|uniref:Phage holin n=1 Tax=plant metagenome TaxID=1297885 RepID=A0A484VFE1_9ZZZZ
MAKLQSVPAMVQAAPDHGQRITSGSWRAGKTSTQRGYGYRWQQERAEYLRLHPFCVRCLDGLGLARASSGEAVINACGDLGLPVPWADLVDHIIEHRGNPALFWDRGNWQGLCQCHHSGDKQREEAARR